MRTKKSILKEYGSILPEAELSDPIPPWEGITWTIDLAMESPRLALQVIELYIHTHYWHLPSGRLKAQEDAASLIRARYIGLPENTDDRIRLIIEREPRDLEILTARLYEAMGYDVTITKKTRDGGRDLIARRTEAGTREYLLVECKRWRATIEVDVPRNLLGVMSDEKAGKGVIIATSFFSPEARKFENRNPRLELVDCTQLVLLLNEHLGFQWPLHIERLLARPVRNA